ncbi:hypothetical protein [Paenibacillus polymyxa]|uniref:Uncharacterized protein n=1 Tax=Paenibacillus polymyxa TaxID=1406 RepID=A0ABX2Z3Q4_PAEPO|nr:hypothetical protein [Paenibacillus polymyxa]ODA05849.1 hypothetical protein A7312_16270 [Paenibacillus polymyxa]
MSKRVCFHCANEIPPNTEHYTVEAEVYCTDCVQAQPYTSYIYYINGEFVGTSDEDNVQLIESYEDEYEGEA